MEEWSHEEPSIQTVDYVSLRSGRTADRDFVLPFGAGCATFLIAGGTALLLGLFLVPTCGIGSRDARVDAAKAMVVRGSNIATQIELFRRGIGHCPSRLSELYEPPEDKNEAAKWPDGGYLSNPDSLKDPWGNELRYRYPGVHNPGKYDLWSTGPDEKDGTEDDIGNWDRD